MLTATKTDNAIPASKQFFMSAGSLRLLPECFVALLAVTYCRHSYLVSVSCIICFVWLIVVLPIIEASIDKIKSPVGSLLMPFAVSSLLLSLLLVQTFGARGYAAPVEILFELLFLPVFLTLILLINSLNQRYERLAGDSKSYRFAALAVKVLSALSLGAVYYFGHGEFRIMACTAAIIFSVAAFLQYLAVFGYVPRLMGGEKKTFAGYVLPHIEMIDRRHIASTIEVVSLVASLVLIANVGVYLLNGTAYYWINAVIMVVYGIARILLPKILADFMNYKARFTYITAISILWGMMLAGFAVMLPGLKAKLIGTAAVAASMILISIVFHALALKKAKTAILEEV